MSTRSSKNWAVEPGNIDSLNTRMMFDSYNEYGIPNMLPTNSIPKDLIMYGTEVRRSYAQTRGKTVHFFLDDYKFEPLWNKPNKTLPPIMNIGSALSPDFSLYLDYPKALQIFNVYRSRWLGRFWQEQGIDVIPTVSWADESTFDFCFAGVPKYSTVAVSTIGVRSNQAREVFSKGFEAMCIRLEPKDLVIYGEYIPEIIHKYFDDDHIHIFQSYWAKRRGELNGR